jgi:hypothetical protein
MKEWELAVRKVEHLGNVIAIGRSTEQTGQAPKIDLSTSLIELQERKQDVVELDKRIREQVRLELLGKSDGQAEESATGSSPSS